MESQQPTDPQDDKVESWIRDQLGATDVVVQRQGRWRPMWLVDATIDGKRRELMVRGERSDAEMGFPLRHEMLLQSFLHERGIMVPAVHGWIEEVPAYVMDRIPGRFDFVGVDESQRDTVMRDYMAILAQIHRLPVEAAAAAGISRSSDSSRTGDVGPAAYERIYRQTKVRPEPFLEFTLGWLERHPLDTTGRESVVLWDAAQFHQLDGKLTTLLDFELGHIGDPMMDLAGMRGRDSVLEFGDLRELYDHYENAGGFPVDLAAIQHHHIAFCLLNRLTFHRALVEPLFDSDYMTNMLWISETDMWAIELIAERQGYVLNPPELPADHSTPYAVALAHLVNTLRNLKSDDEYLSYKLRGSYLLARHAQRADQVGAATTTLDLDETAELLGDRIDNWDEAEAALERFVLEDDGTHDEQLVQLFYRRYARLKNTLGPTGSGMSNHLPVRLHNLRAT